MPALSSPNSFTMIQKHGFSTKGWHKKEAFLNIQHIISTTWWNWCISGFLGHWVLSTWIKKIAADLFWGNICDRVNKVDTSFSLMWFTFILFYSYLLIFMDIHFTWAKWPIQWTVLNSLNIGKPLKHLTTKSSTHKHVLNHYWHCRAAIFSCKTKGAPKRCDV